MELEGQRFSIGKISVNFLDLIEKIKKVHQGNFLKSILGHVEVFKESKKA